MFPPVFETLKADAAVTAILGAAPKVYSHGSAPQGAVPPYVAWLVVGGEPQNNLSSAPDSDKVSFQVDCYALDGAGVRTLATAVRDALERVCHMTGVVIDERETATKFFRVAMQFDYWLNR